MLSTIINALTGGGGAGGLLKAVGGLFAGSKLGKLAAKIVPAIAPIATLGLSTVLPGLIGTSKQLMKVILVMLLLEVHEPLHKPD